MRVIFFQRAESERVVGLRSKRERERERERLNPQRNRSRFKRPLLSHFVEFADFELSIHCGLLKSVVRVPSHAIGQRFLRRLTD